MNENIVLSVDNSLCSEFHEDLASISAKFLICDFDVNANGIMLNRKTIVNWISTLINQPVVAKLGLTDSGIGDFTSHNMNPVIREDENGNPYMDYDFDTEACGVFTDVGIENINGKDCITATAKIWKRFPNFIAVIKRRIEENIPISTSWEIATKKSHTVMMNGQAVKVIDDGQFLGHCMLAKVVPPAYQDSQLLEVASKNEDIELVKALSQDFSEANNGKEANNLDIENSEGIKASVGSDEVSSQDVSEKKALEDKSEGIMEDINNANKENTVVSELTDHDIRMGLYNAIADKLGIPSWYFSIVANITTSNTCWVQRWDLDNSSELDILVFTYTVDNDVVTVSDPVEGKLAVSISEINTKVAELETKIEEQTASLLEANEKMQTLNTEISTLQPFKEKFEQAEQERIEQETAAKREALKNYAIKSGFITDEDIASSEEIKTYIEQVNEKEIRAIIAERFMKSLDDKPVETSTENNNNNEVDVDIVPETSQAKLNINDDGTDTEKNPKAIMKKFLNK